MAFLSKLQEFLVSKSSKTARLLIRTISCTFGPLTYGNPTFELKAIYGATLPRTDYSHMTEKRLPVSILKDRSIICLTSPKAGARSARDRWVYFAAIRVVFVLFAAPLFVTTAVCSNANSPVEKSVRTTESFDEDWRFLKSDANGAEKPNFDDSIWRKLDVPHDWSIEGPFDEKNPTEGAGAFLPAGVGWYRKHFTLRDSIVGKHIFVDFDGVMANSEVWINGELLGKRPYGYVSFRYELTDRIRFGDSPDSRGTGYVRGGIWRRASCGQFGGFPCAAWKQPAEDCFPSV